MKWVTLLCLFLFSIAVASRHLQKQNHETEFESIAQLKKIVGDEKFGYITLVIIAQNLQKSTADEHLKIIADIVEFAQHCEDHLEDKKCKKSLMGIVYDTICSHKKLEEGYEWLPGCCAKEGEEEAKCFDEHKDIEVKVYKIPDAEEACKHHKENPTFSFQHIATDIAKRHSPLSPITALEFVKKYHTMTTECCEAEDKAKCFTERMNLIYEQMCAAASSLNDQTKHCCEDSYVNRKLCFAELGVDSSYHARALEKRAVHIGDDICKNTAEENYELKVGLFIKIVKQNLNVYPDELKKHIADFREMTEKCCAEAEPKECIDKESPAIIAAVKNVLEH